MKYRKLIEKVLSQRSSQNNTQVAIALVAGLAAGAVISMLFAPDKGATIRKGISSKARNLGGAIRDSYESLRNKITGSPEDQDVMIAPEVPHFTHNITKKRKSDIKELINEAHQNGHHTEQSIQE